MNQSRDNRKDENSVHHRPRSSAGHPVDQRWPKDVGISCRKEFVASAVATNEAARAMATQGTSATRSRPSDARSGRRAISSVTTSRATSDTMGSRRTADEDLMRARESQVPLKVGRAAFEEGVDALLAVVGGGEHGGRGPFFDEGGRHV